MHEKNESLELEVKLQERALLEHEVLKEKNEALEKEVKELKAILTSEGYTVEEVEEEEDIMIED